MGHRHVFVLLSSACVASMTTGRGGQTTRVVKLQHDRPPPTRCHTPWKIAQPPKTGQHNKQRSPMQKESPRRPPFVWLHIHKAGGELICTLAKWVREQVVQPSKLCNAYDACPFGDGTLGIITADRNVRVAMSQRPSCQKRMSYMTSHGFTFSSVERDLTIDEVSCGFVTGVMLREPVARMVSDPVTMHNNPVSNKFGTPTQRK